MVEIKKYVPSRKKKPSGILVILPEAEILEWQEYNEKKNFRRGNLTIPKLPISVWEDAKEIDERLPPGTKLKNVKLSVSRDGKFLNLRACEVIGEEKESSPTPSLSLMKCPNCGEKMIWITAELQQTLSRVKASIAKLDELILKYVKGEKYG